MNFLLTACLILFSSLSFADLVPVNKCGQGNRIIKAWSCADASSGGSYALGALVICSQKVNGKTYGYSSKLDDNVVAYGGGYNFGEVKETALNVTIRNQDEIDTLNLKTGFARIQHEKMKCSFVKVK